MTAPGTSPRRSDRLGRPLRFVLVGAASTGLYFLLLILLRDVISPTALLAAVCYLASMSANFLAQARFTFCKQSMTGGSALRYAVMQGIALLANSAAMALLVDVLNWPLLPAQVLVTGAVAVGVYLVSKGWVYR